MTVLLHEGEVHTEAAASSVSPELFALSIGFLLVGVVVLGYAIRQYAGGD